MLLMFVRLPLLLLLLIFATSPRLGLANFHLPNNDNTASFRLTQSNSALLSLHEKKVDNFSTLLQRRILQILAHQLIDDNQLMSKKNLKPLNANNINTHYKTKTFSVSIDSVNTAFYSVSIKDNLQHKETLIRIPR